MTSKNLGDILIERGIIDRDALNKALALQGRRLGEILIEEKLADPVAIAAALKFQATSSQKSRSSRLSIESRLLDDLLNRLEVIEDQLGGQIRTMPAFSSLLSLRQAVELLLLEPVDTLFHKARWVAGQVANELGKEVDFYFDGQGLVIDRGLVEDLSDMLIHLVRNALDHGIESPQERTASGKKTTGTLRIGVSISGSKLFLIVADDGRGIDEEKIYERAKKLGLLDKPRAEVSAEELKKLLFTPGFSTSTDVSPLSGRGVGLDVVEANAIRLGGEVKLESRAGTGVTFTISVPLKCVRMSVVPLRIADEWVAVNSTEIQSVEKAEGLSGLLSARSLFQKTGDSSSEPFAVTCSGGSKWAFEEVAQPVEVLVRETSSFAKGAHGIVGNARMPDGTNALIVDLNLLAKAAARKP